MRWSARCMSLAMLGIGAMALTTAAISSERSELVTQLIVKFKDESSSSTANTGAAKLSASARKSGLALNYKRRMANGHVVTLAKPMSRAEAVAVAKRLELDANVAYAEIDEYVYPQFIPNDSLYALRQWNLQPPSSSLGNVGGANLPAAWDVTRGQNIVIAVLDSGIAAHPDLGSNILSGYDFISDATHANDGDGRDSDASDPGDWQSDTDCPAPDNVQRNSSWHGTYIAGVIAAQMDNGLAGAGIASEARILPLRVIGRCGGFSSDVIDAIRWSVGLPIPGAPANLNIARVINLSIGAKAACSRAYQDAIDAARSTGAVVVASTGNESASTIDSPSSCQGVIAVTGHTYQGDNAKYANVGPGTTLSAPGGGACKSPNSVAFTCTTIDTAATGTLVWSDGLFGATTPSSTNSTGNSGPALVGGRGTSGAAAHVTGAVALLLAQMPTLNVDEVSFLLSSSARPHPDNLFCATQPTGTCGSGLLDVSAAFNLLADRAPLLTVARSSATITEGEMEVLTATATPHNGGSSTLNYAWTQTSGPTVTLLNASTAAPSFTGTNPGGMHVLKVTVTDGNGYRVTQSVSIRSNNAPTMTAPPTLSVAVGQTLTAQLMAIDPENDSLTYFATALPDGASLAVDTGILKWQNVSASVGSYSFDVMANDGIVNSRPIKVTVDVIAPPVQTSAQAGSSGGGGAFSPWLIVLALWLLILKLAGRFGVAKKLKHSNKFRSARLHRLSAVLLPTFFVVGCASSSHSIAQSGLAHHVDRSHVSDNVAVVDHSAAGAPLPDGTRLKLLKMVPPDYPRELRLARIEGVVMVRHSIQPDGSVTRLSIQQSAGEQLDQLALAAVAKWRYEPYTPKPDQLLSVTVPITFHVP